MALKTTTIKNIKDELSAVQKEIDKLDEQIAEASAVSQEHKKDREKLVDKLGRLNVMTTHAEKINQLDKAK